jgi:luciferase family oxidoreductase group 1
MIPLSVLDLVPITAGSNASEALARSLEFARAAERLGYTRFWVAEHHNMPGIASAATAVVIAHLAGGTSTIRVGSGGIMLPNHSPLAIAEQFGTLEALHPGRIDLGLGRAPGSDQITARALRRDPAGGSEFPRDVQELQLFLGPVEEGQAVQAVPGANAHVPLWILGSSTYGAQLAALLGLPFAFASHFAPEDLLEALAVYRRNFQPSAQLDAPYAMAACNVLAADSDAEARHLFTSQQVGLANFYRGNRGLAQPPIDDIEAYWTPDERRFAESMLRYAFVGAPDTVRHGLDAFIEETQADELIVTCGAFEPRDRIRSYELLATEVAAMAPAASAG